MAASILLIGAVVVTVAVCELLVRLFVAQPGLQRRHPPGLYVSHPARGYTLAAEFTREVDIDGRVVRAAVSELGIRSEPREFDRATCKVILTVGDSFTWGARVPVEEAWPARLETELRDRGLCVIVFNAGVPGYSMKQVRQLAVEYAERLDPDLLLVGLFMNGWVRLQDPYVLHEGNLVQLSVVPKVRAVPGGYLYTEMFRPWMQKLDLWLDQYFYIGALAFKASYRLWGRISGGSQAQPLDGQRASQDERAAQETLQLMEEVKLLREEIEKRSLPLAVVMVNPQLEDGTFGARARVQNATARADGVRFGISVVDPLPVLEETANGEPIHRFADDHHWSPRAHEVVGGWLAVTLLEQGLISAGFPAGRPAGGTAEPPIPQGEGKRPAGSPL